MKKISKFLSMTISLMLVISGFSLIASATEQNYSVDLSQVYDANGNNHIAAGIYDYLIAYNNIDGVSSSGNYNGNQAILGKDNGSGYMIFKFDAGEGRILTKPTLSWRGRAISKASNFVNVYIGSSAELDGAWTYIDGIGADKAKYTKDNNYSAPSNTDLTQYVGNGIKTLYVKVMFYRSYGSWTSFSNLTVTGNTMDGTQDTVNVTSIKTIGIADGDEMGEGDSISMTAVAYPIQLTDRTVTVSSNNSSVLSVVGSDGSYTLNGLTAGNAIVTISSGNISNNFNLTIKPIAITNSFDATTTVTVANETDSSKFYSFDTFAINCAMANVVGASVKLDNVSFEGFLDVGADFVKATVAWGAASKEAASFDVYIDSITDEDKVATLYANPYDGSFGKQTVLSYTNAKIYGTHNVFVVFNTPGSIVYDITFGNFDGDYTGDYIRYYTNADSSETWVSKVINYSGLSVEDGSVIRPAYADNAATVIYRVDANEGGILTGISYKSSGRAIGSGIDAGAITAYVSTDMKIWTQIGRLSGTGDTTATNWSLTATDSDITLGSKTVYVKVNVEKQPRSLDSWNQMLGISISPANATDVLAGDTNLDETVDIKDLVRFKKAAGGLETAIADTAYFAGKNNLSSDMIYTRKTLLGIAFNVDRSRYDVTSADSIPEADPETKTPTVFEAYSLAPTTNYDQEGIYNSSRIQYCIDNYHFCKLEAGATYLLDSPISLSSNNDTLIGLSEEEQSELCFCGDSWYVVKMSGSGVQLKNIIVNQNNCYTSGVHLDTSVVQMNGATNAVIDNCIIESGYEPETADIEYTSSDAGTSFGCGLYVLNCDVNCSVLNTTIRNNYYGVIIHKNMTEAMNTTLDNCVITYNRCDGITFDGYAKLINSKVSYNGYDCKNGQDVSNPIPGGGVYSQSTTNGFVIDNCQIFRNNGYNIDINGAANVILTNNNTYDPGWRSFPLAKDYVTVGYGNGISLSLCSLQNSTVTGNTVSNSLATSELNMHYAHLTYGKDINEYLGYANNGVEFSDLPSGGSSIIACLLANYSNNNTITGNTFTAHTDAEGIVGYGLVICRTVEQQNTISGNVATGSDVALIDVVGIYSSAMN